MKAKKLKNYEILIKGCASVVVMQAENSLEAIDLAQDQLTHGDFEVDELNVVSELKTAEQIDRAKRFAQLVI